MAVSSLDRSAAPVCAVGAATWLWLCSITPAPCVQHCYDDNKGLVSSKAPELFQAINKIKNRALKINFYAC